MPNSNDPAVGAALGAARRIQYLTPGELADLRRMDKERRAPAFWLLAAQYPDTIGRSDQEETWVNILRILAILTPKGDPKKRPPLDNPQRRLGRVLCDGGDLAWPGSGAKPRPALSEHRLMKLMAARGPQRAILLTRAARALARSMSPGSGINVSDIAYALINPGNERQIAEPYYRRLDSAAPHSPAEGTSP